MPQRTILTPIGDITISEADEAIVSVDWGRGMEQADTPLLREAARQLNAYFDGSLTDFDLPLLLVGTEHQKQVWMAMLEIPYGTTITYGELTNRAGSGSARSAGTACGQNPIPIIVPCHRVVPASGGVGNYSGEGGTETKAALLRLEGTAMF